MSPFSNSVNLSVTNSITILYANVLYYNTVFKCLLNDNLFWNHYPVMDGINYQLRFTLNNNPLKIVLSCHYHCILNVQALGHVNWNITHFLSNSDDVNSMYIIHNVSNSF